MTSKKHLVYINDSLGELDWLAPYIVKRALETNDEFHLYFKFPAKSLIWAGHIFERYFTNIGNISLVKKSFFERIIDISEYYFEQAYNKLGLTKYYKYYELLSYKLVKTKSSKISYDYLWRDYNLKHSYSLITRERLSRSIIVFPHSTAIESNSLDTPKPPSKSVRCDIFLENSEISNRWIDKYHNQLQAVGSPSLDLFRQSTFTEDPNSILIITRTCYEKVFGFNYEDSLAVFENILRWGKSKNYKIYVKHHPRDNNIHMWRNVQKNYANVIEIESTVNDFSIKPMLVLSFYSSLGVLFSGIGVPVFDISPYICRGADLPFHFNSANGQLTHELVTLGIQSQFLDFENTRLYLESSKESLKALGKHQKENTDKAFPINSVESIDELLEKL